MYRITKVHVHTLLSMRCAEYLQAEPLRGTPARNVAFQPRLRGDVSVAHNRYLVPRSSPLGRQPQAEQKQSLLEEYTVLVYDSPTERTGIIVLELDASDGRRFHDVADAILR
jgi:hypothetical protein